MTCWFGSFLAPAVMVNSKVSDLCADDLLVQKLFAPAGMVNAKVSDLCANGLVSAF